jgi:hypothetical protein
MPIWMHHVLSTIAIFAGFFGGGLLTAILLELIRGGPKWVVLPVVSVALIVFAVGGIRFGEWLVRLLPARCPNCRGRAYAEGHRPIRFRCQECQHVHFSRSRTNWGKD